MPDLRRRPRLCVEAAIESESVVSLHQIGIHSLKDVDFWMPNAA